METTATPEIIRLEASWLAVEKPAGVASIPEKVGDSECLQALLSRHLKRRVWVVHRLDKEVSGVMLFALSAEAHRSLNQAFEARRVSKSYLAGAFGSLAGDSGEVRLPLREFGSGRIGVDEQRGKPCLTGWRVLERKPHATLLEMEPHTGRRHQLRAHARAIGHALIGDPRYGDRALQSAFPRLLLHSRKLEFVSPEGESVSLLCEPGQDFLSCWASV